MTRYLSLFLHAIRFQSEDHVKQANIVLICHDADRTLNYKGKRYSHLLDSLNDQLLRNGYSTITLAKPFSKHHAEVAYGNVQNINSSYARNLLFSSLLFFIGFREWAKLIRINYWISILKRIEPDFLFGIQPPIELCIAAKKLKIKNCDLQHGVISSKGYYGVQFRESWNQQGWPDLILCWDKKSKSIIDSMGNEEIETLVVGNIWFMRFLYPHENDELVSSMKENYIESTDRPRILVSMQWSMDRFGNYDKTGLKTGLIDYMLNGDERYDWLIRLHPVDMQDEDRKNEVMKLLNNKFKGRKNIEWEKSSNAPLPCLLQSVDLHITSHSAITIEASWFGVKTALLDERHDVLHEYFADLISLNIAELVNGTSDDIGQWIDRNILSAKNNKKNSFNPAGCRTIDSFLDTLKRTVNR